MEIKEKKAKVCLMIDGERVGLDAIAGLTPEFLEQDISIEALTKNRKERIREAHARRDVAVAEACAYCEGYIEGLDAGYRESWCVIKGKIGANNA